MRVKKILCSILAIAMMLSTMGIAVLAVEEPAAPELDLVAAVSDEYPTENWIDSADTSWYTEGEDAYTISTAEELAGLAKLVNEGTAFCNGVFNNVTITLDADVDLDGKMWTPIGGGEKNNTFAGIFDGGNNNISNLCVVSTYGNIGLFGRCAMNADFGLSAEVKNFTVNNAVVKASGRDAVGAAVGYGHTELKVDNVKVTGVLDIFGYRGVAAVVGKGYADIYNCTVEAEGTIAAQYWCAGGILGHSDEPCVEIEGCSVNGTDDGLTIDGGSYNGAGGIAGYIASGSKIEDVTVSDVTIEGDSYYHGGYIAGNGYTNAVDAKVIDVQVLVDDEPYIPDDAETVIVPVAEVGGEYYATLPDAIAAAAENADEANPQTVNIFAGEYELGNYVLPNMEYVTLKGASEMTTVIKNTVITNAGKATDNLTGITFDGIVFDNSRIYLNGWTNGMKFADWTITNCEFSLDTDTAVGGVIQFNLSSAMVEGQYGPWADCALDGFTFTNNVIDSAHGKNVCSAINSQATEGNIVIENNIFKNVDWNAIQLQHTPETATVSIKNNTFENIGSTIIGLTICATEEFDIEENTFIANSSTQKYISMGKTNGSGVTIDVLPVIDASCNFWGYKENEEVVCNENYTAGITGGIANLSQYAPYYFDEERTSLSTPVAEVNGKKYMTLKLAVESANDGDIVYVAPGTYTDELVINKSITLTGNPNYGTATLSEGSEIEKPVIKISDVTNGGVEYHATNVTFDNLVFEVVEDATGSTWNIAAIGYYYENTANREGLTVTNCDFINNSNISLGAIAANIGKYTITNNTFTNFATGVWSYVDHGAADEIVVSDNTFANVADLVNIYHGAAADGTANVTIVNNKATDGSTTQISVVDFGQTKATPATAYDNVVITDNDAEVVLGNYAKDSFNDTIENNYSVVYTYSSEAILRALESAGVPDGDVYVNYGSSSEVMYKVVDGKVYAAADALEVEFELASEAEGEKVYNINLKANAQGIINRLNSADLTFLFSQVEGENAYEIIASNSEVVINPVDNSDVRYEFHYNGKTDVTTDTDTIITIGQVKFTGYGKFSFAVDASVDTNAAHSTTMQDNIVDTFVPGGILEDGTEVGDFDITDNTITDVEITVPTRTLTIDITFPNAVVNNVKAYQDMTVTIVGGTVNETIALGTDGEAYNFTRELPYNTAYTVTVSGAGYRTARYTVNLNDDKQLNFWNNVMDEAQVVEIGKDSSVAKVTFLAGDIVKDNNINIYDLSAVVSYFGTENLVEDYPEYAKYDLNRDGVIDSKDVAYVLVSWNN